MKGVISTTSYGMRLVKLRGTRSQAEVAKSVGIATSTLGMYETEKRVPRDSIKVALAKFYGTTVQEIFFDEEHYEKKQPISNILNSQTHQPNQRRR